MSLQMVFVLVASAASIVALVVGLRRRFWTSVGAWFVVAAAVYHALSEVLTALAPERNRYRSLVSQQAIDNWLVWAGLAILAFTITYLLTLGRRRRQLPQRDRRGALSTIRFFDWRYCLAVTLPLYLIALSGQGFVPGSTSEGGYFEAGLTAQFLLLGMALTSLAACLHFRRFLPVVLAQSVALALLGQRYAVVFGLVILCLLLARLGLQLTRRQIGALVLLGSLGAVVLSAARIEAGRADFGGGQGAASRVRALTAGAMGLFDGDTLAGLADDYVYRIDGNSFASMLLAEHDQGVRNVGSATMVNSLLLAVPSFLDPDKKSSALVERDEKAYLIDHYGLPSGIDFLPGILGAAVSYYGPVGLLPFAGLLGAMAAIADRWLGRNSPVRMVAAAGLLSSVLHYEQGLQTVPITLRGALLVVLAVWGLQHLSRVLRSLRRPYRLGVRRVIS
jgi:hypothetical protein